MVVPSWVSIAKHTIKEALGNLLQSKIFMLVSLRLCLHYIDLNQGLWDEGPSMARLCCCNLVLNSNVNLF